MNSGLNKLVKISKKKHRKNKQKSAVRKISRLYLKYKFRKQLKIHILNKYKIKEAILKIKNRYFKHMKI